MDHHLRHRRRFMAAIKCTLSTFSINQPKDFYVALFVFHLHFIRLVKPERTSAQTCMIQFSLTKHTYYMKLPNTLVKGEHAWLYLSHAGKMALQKEKLIVKSSNTLSCIKSYCSTFFLSLWQVKNATKFLFRLYTSIICSTLE